MTATPTIRWTAKALMDFAFDLHLDEKKYLAFRGGPLRKQVILDAINNRLDQLHRNLAQKADADQSLAGNMFRRGRITLNQYISLTEQVTK